MSLYFLWMMFRSISRIHLKSFGGNYVGRYIRNDQDFPWSFGQFIKYVMY